MDGLKTYIDSNIPLIPKELIPAVSGGLIIAAIIFVLIFFIICILYINYKPKPPTRPEDKSALKDEGKIIAKYEELPMISGRIGEILALNGILDAGDITKTFIKVLEAMKHSTYDLRWRYKLPCFLIAGASGSGKSTLLQNLNFEHLTADGSAINSMWKLFKRGAIFEAPDQTTDADKFWSFLAELFVFIRPRRPLDGVIVTVPADILMNEHANAAHQAQILFDKIFKFQHDVNFRLPIYVVVTKCDEIFGFSEFGHLFSEDAKQQIIGWSSPYELKAAFSTSWINEIFSTMDEGIRKAVIAFSRDKETSEDLEKALLFEGYLNKLKPKVSQYLEAMFRAHNPEEGMLFRGIYFVGKQKEIAKASHEILQPLALSPKSLVNMEVASHQSYNNHLYFVQDLFSEKIFKEYNIAHPINIDAFNLQHVNFRNKAILSAGYAIFVVGWLWGNYNIKSKLTEYKTKIGQIKSAMGKIQRLESRAISAEDQAVINKCTTELLREMPTVKRSDFVSIFVPQSWFSSLRKRTTEALKLVFDSVVVRAMYIDLNINTRNILEPHSGKRMAENGAEKTDLFDTQTFSSFKNLQEFVKNVKELKKVSGEYNSLNSKDSGKNIADITHALFHDEFEIVEEMKNHEPNKKLIPPKFDIDLFSENIEETFGNLFKTFLRDVFDGRIEKIFDSVAEDIKHLSDVAQSSAAQYTAKDLAKIYSKCLLLQEVMKNKHFGWISGKHFIPSDAYKKLIGEIRTSEIVGLQCLKDSLALAENEFYKFKDQLCSHKTELTGKLLEADIKALSPDFQTFINELKLLLEQQFVCTAPKKKSLSGAVFEDKMLIWDIKLLKELSLMIDKYYEFTAEAPEGIRPEFFDTYKAIIRKCFFPVIQAKLGNAQFFEDLPYSNSRNFLEETYRRQTSNTKATCAYLAKIVKIIDEIQGDDSLQNSEFEKLIVSQYLNMLGKIDALFNQEKPYSADDTVFDSWEGEQGPQYVGMSSKAALKQYLSAQFERIKALSELASPLVDILSLPALYTKIKNKQVIEKWKSITASVDDYIAQKPGNSIAALENFVSITLAQTSLNSFDPQGEIKSFSEDGGDYFLDTRSSVAKSLLSRAETVKYERAAKKYNAIYEFFNSHFFKKFPFGNYDDDVLLSDIKDFVEKYENEITATMDTLKTYQKEKNINGDVLDFLEQISRLMSFLKLWVQHTKSSDMSTAGVIFNVQMRPDPSLEANVSSVLDRKLTVNGAAVEDGDNCVFFNDNPVAITFGWIAKSEDHPLKTNGSGDLTVEGQNATFSFDGAWAMLRMIEQQKINKGVDFDGGILLKFEVPCSSENGNVTSTMVIKVVPMQKAGDKTEPLTWPIFPVVCPPLHGKTLGLKEDPSEKLFDNNRSTESPKIPPLDTDVSFDGPTDENINAGQE